MALISWSFLFPPSPVYACAVRVVRGQSQVAEFLLEPAWATNGEAGVLAGGRADGGVRAPRLRAPV